MRNLQETKGRCRMTYTQTVMQGVTISLKALRKQYSMSQKTLAGLMQVDQTTVSKWEHGKQIPTRSAVQRMAEIFHVDYADMDRTFLFQSGASNFSINSSITSVAPKGKKCTFLFASVGIAILSISSGCLVCGR